MLSRKIVNIYNDITRKGGKMKSLFVSRKLLQIKIFKNKEKLKHKKNKLTLDINFLNRSNNLVCIRNSLSLIRRMFQPKMLNVSKELSLSELFLSTQLSTVAFYILKKYTTSHNKKLLKKY